MAKRLKLCEVHSFSTSSNLHHGVGLKFKVILFDVKYVKNCKSYDVTQRRLGLYRVPMSFTLDELERLKVKVAIL